MDALENRVIAFVARERGIRAAKISLTSRLNHDLGMDGDDAVEFFEKFGREFSVDLKPLGHAWDQHFVPEGGPHPLLVVAWIGLFGLGAGVHALLHWVPTWLAGISLIVIWTWPLRCWPFCGADLAPVTVTDLVDAAQTGSRTERPWPALQ